MPPEEQILFRRLAVFVGGCTLEAAEAVANPRRATLDVFGGLERLVEQSLLRQEEGPDGEPRFTHAGDGPRVSGWSGSRRAARPMRCATGTLAFYLAFAEGREQTPCAATSSTLAQIAWKPTTTISARRSTASVTRALPRGPAPRGAYAPYWYVRGHVREGWDRLHRALAMAGTPMTMAKGHVLNSLGSMAIRIGNLPAASKYGQEALAIWETVGDPRGRNSALFVLAMVKEPAALGHCSRAV